MKNKFLRDALDLVLVAVGAMIYAVGFDMFMAPNHINAGGLTGLMMIVVELLGRGSVGTLTIICNVPLFLLGWKRLGRKFFIGSLIGMLSCNTAIDLLAPVLPQITSEPLLACLYGGAMAGLSLGIVFSRGASTGGTDIIARLTRSRLQNFSMGKVMLGLDLVIVTLTGIVFNDLNKVLYCAVTLYVSSIVLDAVVYGFDYSKVALIISEKYEEIARMIGGQMSRGATLLHGKGAYTNQEKTVILVAFKKKQLAELKSAVAEIDPQAFIIVQDAHQVQGEGFSRYSKDAL